MPKYLEGPDGPIRYPDDLPEAALAEILLAQPQGQEVELAFIRNEPPELAAEDGAVGEVVARVFMPRENYERLVEMLPRGPEVWRDMGL